MEIYLINDTTATIEVRDLHGVNILSQESLDILSLYPYEWVERSNDLKTYVTNGDIIINDGVKNLTPEEGVEMLLTQTIYGSRHPLVQHTDLGNPPSDKHTVIKRNKDTQSYEWEEFPPNVNNLGLPIFPNELSDKDDAGVLTSDGTAFVWAKYFEHGNGVATAGGINFTMSDHQSRDYVANANRTWVTIRSFIYDGTNLWIPEKFAIIASRAGQVTTGYARLFDYTNGNEIAQIEWTDELKSVYINSTLQNLPQGQAIFELQTKTSNNGREIRSHYMALF